VTILGKKLLGVSVMEYGSWMTVLNRNILGQIPSEEMAPEVMTIEEDLSKTTSIDIEASKQVKWRIGFGT